MNCRRALRSIGPSELVGNIEGYPKLLQALQEISPVPIFFELIDFGGRSPERAHANDAGADVFSPEDAVIRREISVSCLWDLDASPDTGFYF